MSMNGYSGEICADHEIQSFLSDFICKKKVGSRLRRSILPKLNASVNLFNHESYNQYCCTEKKRELEL